MGGGRKSRHYRDESDLLLGIYGSTLAKEEEKGKNNNGNGGGAPSNGDVDYGYGTPDAQPHPPRRTFSFKQCSESSSPGKPANHPFNNNSNKASSNNNNGKRKKKRKGYRVHRVSYTAQNHVQVLFRGYASAFPQVSPFVLANVLWTLGIYYLKCGDVVDLTFHSSTGHSFMGLLVSFLIVNRSQIAYNRFMEFRRHLAECYRTCRELAQYATVYTYQTQTPDGAYWRQELCYRTILLLRVTMDALLWSSTERETWEDEYFKFDRERDAGGADEGGRGENSRVSKHFYLMKQLSHGRRSYIDENFRSPINFSHMLRQVIMEHSYYLGYKMPVNEYRDLLGLVEKFVKSFHSFRVLVFTPYPFPLLQMSRALLFFWVYTLPMVLLKDYRLWSTVLIVVLISFGFIGIEYVSMSLDDPFGDDTNDIDEHGMSLLVYEDIYIAIYRTDGPDAAVGLRNRVLDRYRQGRELQCYRDDLKGWDMWEMPEWWFEQKQCDDAKEATRGRENYKQI